jgi:thiamine biosynthesis lipoprotein
MELDFGGFGKEYAADRAATMMAARGAKHGYVNLAGDLRVLGPKPDGAPWMIGIQDPRRRGEVIATIPVYQGGLATSGDYERYFELEGQRYCHILDPNTGWPVTHWRTVSVLAPLAVVAGNCSTIAMLKQADGLAFLQASGMNFLAMDQHGAIHTRVAAAA